MLRIHFDGGFCRAGEGGGEGGMRERWSGGGVP